VTSATGNDPAGVCARPGCGEPLVRKARGRPPLYCSPACRHAVARRGPVLRLLVEVDHDRDETAGRPTGHVWVVRLRRGERLVEVASGLGRPSAEYLARRLRDLIESSRPAGGDEMR
jgi:hypothetical protein